ncbi:hypothetical protein QN277_018183 [Acacia crassicarpa]|uniref:Uncharacterized protein n=1 Tax=Acacia crassicarpa TaxID=499986 RepID=A0AAE1JQK5_9FABA|nr:hypothetical protein QN277_018183 [Acacia crassicarpa]
MELSDSAEIAGNPALYQTHIENNHDETEPPMAVITLHAILGRSSTTTMKVKGTIFSHEILILIDSGSSHNFISNTLVADLGIPTQQLPPFGVLVGDGALISCQKICTNVEIKVQQVTICEEFFPFNLGGVVDMVLGIKWLASLNTVAANWQQLFMIFWVDGKRYKLQGLTQPSSQVTLRSYDGMEIVRQFDLP